MSDSRRMQSSMIGGTCIMEQARQGETSLAYLLPRGVKEKHMVRKVDYEKVH